MVMDFYAILFQISNSVLSLEFLKLSLEIIRLQFKDKLTKECKFTGARIIRTKIRENFVQIKQNVRIIQMSKSVESMGKYTFV